MTVTAVDTFVGKLRIEIDLSLLRTGQRDWFAGANDDERLLVMDAHNGAICGGR